ncbi:MAG TPA: response regulator [Acetobacteraceae bacterium]|jgi:DNA-binding response OmpR family regulator|nr:response regulator [Acetobacteraceae bacterium]
MTHPEIRDLAANAKPLTARRVLVVEDELMIAMLIEGALQQAGCEVIGPLVRLGPALTAATEGALDIAVLDRDLAGEDTRPVAETLEARGVPFVFLTGYGTDSLPPDKPHWRALGKPFRTQTLIAALTAMVAPAPQPLPYR